MSLDCVDAKYVVSEDAERSPCAPPCGHLLCGFFWQTAGGCRSTVSEARRQAIRDDPIGASERKRSAQFELQAACGTIFCDEAWYARLHTHDGCGAAVRLRYAAVGKA